MNKRDLINKVRHGTPHIRIGKRGLSENLISDVSALLTKYSAIKIKCLKSIPSKSVEPIADNLAKLTNGKVIETRGKTIILFKE